MKAMILAAGLGLRMRPLTALRAKPVLPVLNRPLLHWTLATLARHGVTDVVVNLHHLGASVRRALGDGRAFGVRIAYVRERTILGTGGGPRHARRLLGEAPILLVNGDVAFDVDLDRLVAAHRASGAPATLLLRPNPDPRRYGPVVTGRDGFIRSLVGLPRPARGTVSLFAGIHVVDPALFERLPPGASDSVRDLYAPLVADGMPPFGVRLPGAWYDLGSPGQYLRAQLAMLASGFGGLSPAASLVHPDAIVERGAVVRRSILGAGARIGNGATVSGCVVWERGRVADGARVRDCVVASGAAVDRDASSAIVVPIAALGASPRPAGRVRGGQLWADLN